MVPQPQRGKTLAERLGAGADRLSSATVGLQLQAPDGPWTSSVLLSALPSEPAQTLEVQLAEAGHLVVSNASAHRMGELVPLIIPEVNSNHLDLVARQPWKGALVTNPNCSAVGLAVALAPLHETFGIESVVTTSFQAISGAGLPGPPASSLVDNVIPFVGGEEDKLTCEPQKDPRDGHIGGPGAGDLSGERVLHEGGRIGRPSTLRIGRASRPPVGRGRDRSLRRIPGFGRL